MIVRQTSASTWTSRSVPCCVFCIAAYAAFAPALAASGDEAAASVPSQYRLLPALPPGAVADIAPGEVGGRQEFVLGMPDTLLGGGGSPFPNFDGLSTPLERPRATYRYAWHAEPNWDIKVGLTTTLDPAQDWQRFLLSSTDRLRASSIPTMHFSSQGRLAERWLLSVNAEGLYTQRGQGLDMDFRVDYSLTPNFYVFGGYRLTDSTGDGAETFGFIPSYSARFGVRLRF